MPLNPTALTGHGSKGLRATEDKDVCGAPAQEKHLGVQSSGVGILARGMRLPSGQPAPRSSLSQPQLPPPAGPLPSRHWPDRLQVPGSVQTGAGYGKRQLLRLFAVACPEIWKHVLG